MTNFSVCFFLLLWHKKYRWKTKLGAEESFRFHGLDIRIIFTLKHLLMTKTVLNIYSVLNNLYRKRKYSFLMKYKNFGSLKYI